ncbi:MAG: Hpt domain-containing protein [Isosphaeraceae bacterium]
MTSEGGLEDFSLMDLFRSEVETHSEVLNAALLALERMPDDRSRISEMMRAAHSIKGAARVVGVDPAVNAAHVMEDCFIAAQQGTLTLTPADVDVLLRGVDLLGKISEATKDPKADLAAEFDGEVKSLVRLLEAMLAGKPVEPEPAAAPEPEPEPPPVPTPAPVPIPVAGKPAPFAPVASATTLAFPEFLNAEAAEAMRQRFLAAAQGHDTIRLDLRSTRDLDVQGLVLLAAIPQHVARHGRPAIKVAGVSSELETVLGITGLAPLYGLRPWAEREGA